MSVWIYALISVIFVSLISLVGVIFIGLKPKVLTSLSHLLISLAVGTLLGDAFIHLIPESYEQLSSQPLTVPLLLILGVIIFFIVEKYIHFRHCHQPDCRTKEHSHPVVAISLIGDAVHNFLDGLAISAAYVASPVIGLSTTLAIVAHEIPQEIGDYGIYIHNGLSRLKALSLNLISSLSAILGAIVGLTLTVTFTNYSIYLLPITAGGFIYLALSDLVPQLHQHTRPSVSLIQLGVIILGVLLMVGLTFLE